ncbi:MAG TPA: spermidine/putrescine ABC transporter substrate-binding protein [Thermoanaerobaculia bacterium]|nr:spermidine/putrescine ABC transporter substrate-binding protein [Thermoanaerobaculia bacterium]
MSRLARAAAGGILAAAVLAGAACGPRGDETPYPGPGEKKLNLYIWSEYLPKEVIDEFTRRTGIAVHYDLYDSNEPVLEKLQSGVADYDLVVPSDYMVRILIELKLLRPLDRARLKNLKNLDPRFLDKQFDPGNAYSLPYVWGTTGYGYDKTKAGRTEDSWAPLFDPRNRGQILMLDDMRECFAAALKFLGHSLNSTDPAILKQAAVLLKKQKDLVKTYNSGDYENILAAGDVWFAHGYNGQLARVAAADPRRFGYVLPKEGATLWMDSVCIPARARNVESIYAFLDYVLEPEVNARIVNGISYASPNVPARKFIRPEILNDPAIYPSEEALAKCELLEDIGDATTILDEYWTEIKAQ